MTNELKRTALYDWHVAQNARMVPFAGWEMPVQYPTGPNAEHKATREAAGLFDIDHMGQVEVRGPDAEAFVNLVVSYDVSKMELFDAHYGMLCYADGGVIDDLFIYKLPDDQAGGDEFYFFIAVNASNRDKDFAWMEAHSRGFDIELNHISDETYMIAFQGPKAPEIMNRLTESDITKMTRFTGRQETLFGDVPVLLGRTGYTGEDGFELFFPVEFALKVWEGLIKEGEKDGVLPVGLAARDSLRFEACMPLYGQELNAELTAVNARLNFAVSYDKVFIGRDAILKTKLEKSGPLLIGFEMVEKSVPRHGYEIAVDGQVVGEVTSGMATPTVGKFLGLGFIERKYAKVGTEIDILVRGKPKKAVVVKRPFYTPVYRK